jgi:alpha-glucosidase
MIALNLGDRPEAAEFQGHRLDGRLLLSSHLDRDGEKVRGTIDLRPNEGVMIEIER